MSGRCRYGTSEEMASARTTSKAPDGYANPGDVSTAGRRPRSATSPGSVAVGPVQSHPRRLTEQPASGGTERGEAFEVFQYPHTTHRQQTTPDTTDPKT